MDAHESSICFGKKRLIINCEILNVTLKSSIYGIYIFESYIGI